MDSNFLFDFGYLAVRLRTDLYGIRCFFTSRNIHRAVKHLFASEFSDHHDKHDAAYQHNE